MGFGAPMMLPRASIYYRNVNPFGAIGNASSGQACPAVAGDMDIDARDSLDVSQPILAGGMEVDDEGFFEDHTSRADYIQASATGSDEHMDWDSDIDTVLGSSSTTSPSLAASPSLDSVFHMDDDSNPAASYGETGSIGWAGGYVPGTGANSSVGPQSGAHMDLDNNSISPAYMDSDTDSKPATVPSSGVYTHWTADSYAGAEVNSAAHFGSTNGLNLDAAHNTAVSSSWTGGYGQATSTYPSVDFNQAPDHGSGKHMDLDTDSRPPAVPSSGEYTHHDANSGHSNGSDSLGCSGSTNGFNSNAGFNPSASSNCAASTSGSVDRANSPCPPSYLNPGAKLVSRHKSERRSKIIPSYKWALFYKAKRRALLANSIPDTDPGVADIVDRAAALRVSHGSEPASGTDVGSIVDRAAGLSLGD
ncbi:hypothetical protein FBU31_003008 [Coemansia sp. 'formosensis']|nr:hypothetical protein FBU31_003008 [Coemansia sp. 'formosensis']